MTAVLEPFIQSDDGPGLDHSSVTLAGFGLVSGHLENRKVSTLSGELDVNSFFHLSGRAYECKEGEQPENGLILAGRNHGDLWGDQMSSQWRCQWTLRTSRLRQVSDREKTPRGGVPERLSSNSITTH